MCAGRRHRAGDTRAAAGISVGQWLGTPVGLLAREARAQVEQMPDPGARRDLLEIACGLRATGTACRCREIVEPERTPFAALMTTIPKYNHGLGTPASDERFRGGGAERAIQQGAGRRLLVGARQESVRSNRPNGVARSKRLEIAAGYQRLAHSTEERNGRAKSRSS
jgi:hypothetical protein